MNAVDTNVLLYARDSRVPDKRAVAVRLIESLSDTVLIWQVACEYVAASRKLEPTGYGRTEAWRDILDLAMVWPLQFPSAQVLDGARDLSVTHSVSTWDALLIGACYQAGVTRLYTEDLQHGSTLFGVEVVNPFR